MGTRIAGRKGKVLGQSGVNPVAMVQLTAGASNIIYSGANDYWVQSPAPEIRVDGVISGARITPDAATGKVDVAAGTAFVIGTEVSNSAADALVITRPANVKYNINSILMDSSGTITALTGSDGDAFSTTRAAAGGPPLVTVDKIEIGQVRLYSDTVAVIDPDEIYQDDIERADVPAYKINYVTGDVSFTEALAAIHTGTVAREVWAAYSYASFIEIGDLRNWSVTIPGPAMHEVTAFNDSHQEFVPGVVGQWTGAAGGYLVNGYWFDFANDNNLKLVKLYPDRDTTVYFEGMCAIGWSTPVAVDAAVTEDITLNGAGELIRRTS